MNEDASKRQEEHFADLFMAGEEALLTGKETEPAPAQETPSPPELHSRLQRNLECVQLLRQALRPGPDASGGLPWETLGRFRLRRELGRGGFGIVYLADDPLLNRQVALKVPRAEAAVSAELRERFQREARAAAGLDHPNLVPIYEAGEVGPVCFLVCAYCPGISLSHWLKQNTDPVPFRDAAQFMAIVAAAVGHAHQRGIIHRDLKPANVLLALERGAQSAERENDESPFALSALRSALPRITDFGLAKFSGAEANENPTRSGTILGTVNYMPPEQAAGKARTVGPAADVYSLGAMLYQLLTRRPPFQGETELETLQDLQRLEPVPPSRLRPRLPRDLETICLKCLQKDPARRYADATALADDLRHFLHGEPIRAHPVGRLEKVQRWCRRNPYLAAASSLALLALVAVTIVSTGWAVHGSMMMADLKDAKDETDDKATKLEKEKKDLEETTEKLLKEKEARRQALVMGAGLARERALGLCAQGNTGVGLLWLARALQIAPEENGPLAEGLRAQLDAWAAQLIRLKAIHDYPNPIITGAFRPDGRLVVLATMGEPRSVQLFVDGKPAAVLMHPAAVSGHWISSDGRYALTLAADRAVRLWDTAAGKAVGQPLFHEDQVYSAGFSPAGRTLWTVSAPNKVTFWEMATGKPLGPPVNLEKRLRDPALSADGKTAWSVAAGSVKGWDVATGKLIATLPMQGSSVEMAVFSGDGKKALVLSDQPARLWDLSKPRPEPFGDPIVYKQEAVSPRVAFSPDANTILIAGMEEARLWDAVTGRPLEKSFPLQKDVDLGGYLAFSPDSKIAATFNKGARLWDVATGELIGQILPHGGQDLRLAFGPDGKSVLTWNAAGKTARRWQVGPGPGPKDPSRQAGVIRALAFAPDGKSFWVACNNIHTKEGEVQHLDIAGQRLGELLSWPEPTAAAFSAGGKRLALAGKTQGIQFWDTATRQPVAAPAALPMDVVTQLTFNPAGTVVLSEHSARTKGTTGRLWDAFTGRPVGEPFPQPAQVLPPAFSPDGKYFLVAGNNQAQLWDVATQQPAGKPLPHRAVVRAVAFSPDGHSLLTSMSGVQFWDRATGQPVGTTLPHSIPAELLLCSPDGSLLLIAGGLTARLWRFPELQPLGPPLVMPNPTRASATAFGFANPSKISAAAFSLDSKIVLLGSRDGHLRLWKVPAPVSGPAERIALWTEVLTGLELDADGATHLLDAASWEERRQRLHQLEGPSP